QHLVSLDDEIARLQERLEQLEANLKRRAVSSYKLRNNAIISPLRRIPPEVIGEIFLWTSPEGPKIPRRCGFRVSDSPWFLTHISRRWRAVCISTHSL
ncbi:hypothetical protein C8F04DRAFT_1050711, partial [Mycena alexandri]